jgi:TP901 family phage tail tape measure protein
MPERRVKVIFSAEVQGLKAAMAAAATATKEAKKASEEASKAADKSAKEIEKQALAHHAAAKAAGLQYDQTGQLVTMNGKALNSQQAAAHGLETFSKEAYLAGRAAVEAGDAAAAAAKKAEEAEKKAAKAAQEHRAAREEIGAILMTAGAATVAGVGLAVKAYADFDKQMSSVRASTHETAGNMQLLRDAAVKYGADTSFSAVEAAQGIEELAKAGVSTKDILGGGLKGSLDLAAAGALSVAEAAEISASALTQFKLKGDQIPHLADLLAAGAGKAQGSVSDLGAALNQSGLVASSTGLTIEETTGALAAFASAGLTGSDAGTSFKTMLMSLNPNSEAAAKAMEQLGIKAYDANGEFVGMSEYAGILQKALRNMSDEQRNATLKTIFGSDAVRAANVLYEQGAEGIQQWEDAVNDAGYAAETAAIMQDNLAGDIEKLGGSIDSVFLKSGSGANDFLRGLAQSAEDLIDGIGQIPGPVLSIGATIAGVVGIAALGAGAFLNLTPKIHDAREAFDKLAPSGSRARRSLEGVGKAAGGAMALGTVATVLGKLAEADYMSKIDTGMGRVAKSLAQVAANSPGAAAGIDSLFKNKDGGQLINTVDSLDSALKRTFSRDGGQQFNDWGESMVNTFTGIKGSSHILEDSLKRVDTGLADMVSSGNADGAAKSFDLIKDAAERQNIPLEELKKKFPEYADALEAADAEQIKAADSGDKVAGSLEGAGTAAEVAAAQTEEIEKAFEEVGLAADGSITDIEKWTQSLFSAGLLSLSASDASIAYQAAIDNLTASVVQNGTSLDINTEQGRANQSAYNGIAQTAMAAMTATAAQTLATEGSAAAQAQLQTSLRTSYDDLVAAAGQFGIVGDEADTMARKALGVPKNVNIDAWIADHASQTIDGIKSKADNLDGTSATVTILTRNIQQYEEIFGDTGKSAGLFAAQNGGVTGGRVSDIMGFASGGKVPGTAPANPTVDNILATVNGKPLAVRSGEWIINETQSKKHDGLLAAINAGTFQGYADGGRVGNQSPAPQHLFYSNNQSAGPASFLGDLYLDSGEFLGKVRGVARQEAAGVVATTDRNSSFMRKGR